MKKKNKNMKKGLPTDDELLFSTTESSKKKSKKKNKNMKKRLPSDYDDDFVL